MKLKDVEGANESLTQVAFTTNFETYLQLRQTWLAFLILLGISIVVILITLIFLRNRIRIAISLIGQGSKYVHSHWHFSPLLLFNTSFLISPLIYDQSCRADNEHARVSHFPVGLSSDRHWLLCSRSCVLGIRRKSFIQSCGTE